MSFSVFNRKQVVSDKPDFILNVGCYNPENVRYSTTPWLKKCHLKTIKYMLKALMSAFFKKSISGESQLA